ncbi:MAG: 6-phosphofructokinase [Solirubrobacteraceae bacterium]|nr:6-phosphofructokinase [Solirubrobacteraceae bacterium]
MRVGILTAGGDCPGLNAVIRAAARRLMSEGHQPVGLLRGYRGLAEPDLRIELDDRAVSGILHLGGTIVSTSSFDPFMEPEGVERVLAAQQSHPLDAIIGIGGEHTQWITARLHEQLGLPVVGVPKTIDNDVVGTDYTFGFDTAVQVATDAIDRLHTTAQSHDRVMIVEVMGRNSGWIALYAGIAGGADGILVPEIDTTVEELVATIERRHNKGKNFSIIVVAEGAKLAFEGQEAEQILASDETDEYGYVRLGGIGAILGQELEKRTGFETRITVLGHVQRGGTPTATDRVLATRYGIKAADMVMAGEFGRMAALVDNKITSIPLTDVDGVKPIDFEILEEAKVFFG